MVPFWARLRGTGGFPAVRCARSEAIECPEIGLAAREERADELPFGSPRPQAGAREDSLGVIVAEYQFHQHGLRHDGGAAGCVRQSRVP